MQDALLGQQDEHPIYVVVWDNVRFHRALQVREWFNMTQGFINLCLPPYSPFLVNYTVSNITFIILSRNTQSYLLGSYLLHIEILQ